jgi:hypothetical protein
MSSIKRTHPSWRFFFTAVVAIVGVIGAGFFFQWDESVRLRTAFALSQMELRDAERLRKENHRLRKAQPSASELVSLRADHAALVRLRAEFESLAKSEAPP